MLLMIIHALGIDKCVVVVNLWYFCDFCKNGLKMEKFDFDEFEWSDEVVVLSVDSLNFCFELWVLGVGLFGTKFGFLSEKVVLNVFDK